ncbi:MAG: penicillin-binding protein [Bacteroidetes bacterium]|nr:MAG: penicillin-binding protein [Bacteroidota bacterium]
MTMPNSQDFSGSQQKPPLKPAFAWKKWLRYAGYGVAAMVGLALLLFVGVWLGLFGRLPNEKDLSNVRNHNASRVYSSDGVLLGKFYIQNRTNVAFEDLSPELVNALIATEDARFYEHSGVDGRSLMRVVFKSVLLGDESSGGGSTLSQQLAKNLYPRKNLWLLTMPVAKIKEMLIAQRLERVYSKEEILALYLNTVPFGENVFGIGAATQRFFSTSPDKLRVEDAAVLVGMLKATTYYNPRNYPERAQERRNVVLEQLAKGGHISEAKSDSLKQLPMGLKYNSVQDGEGIAPYFRDKLAEEVKAWLKENPRKDDGHEWNLYTDGLKIYTSIDSRLQRYAETAVKEHMKQLQKAFDQHWKGKKLWKADDPGIVRAVKQSDRYKSLQAQGLSESKIQEIFAQPIPMRVWNWEGENQEMTMSPLDSVIYFNSFLQAGFMAMEAKTGYVRAWVGGINHEVFKYDHVTARRQVGSTFKPFVYAAALASGADPCEYIPNEKVTFEGGAKDWAPENADGKYGGYYTLQGGLTNSVNTVSAAVLMKVGLGTAYDFVKKFGFEEIPRDPTLVLGTADISLMDMVRAYSAFANRGERVTPVYLTKIEDADGNVLVDMPVKPKKYTVMEQPVADMMNRIMRSVVDSGTASRLRRVYGLKAQIAGKTGTTQDQTDGWFMGYTPDLVAGAWVGGDDRKVRFRSLGLGQGASTALPIFGRFMAQMYQSGKYRKWSESVFEEPGVAALESMDCPMFTLEPPLDEEIYPEEKKRTLRDFILQLKEKQDERRRSRMSEYGEDPDLYNEPDSQADSLLLDEPRPGDVPDAAKRKNKWELLFEFKDKKIENDEDGKPPH